MPSCLTLLWPRKLWPTRLLSPWDFPGEITGEGCHALLQGIFPTQGSNLCLLPLSHQVSLRLHNLPSKVEKTGSKPKFSQMQRLWVAQDTLLPWQQVLLYRCRTRSFRPWGEGWVILVKMNLGRLFVESSIWIGGKNKWRKDSKEVDDNAI